MNSEGVRQNIGICLPPTPRGPGMIRSAPLDVANMIAVLKEAGGKDLRLFDLRAHVIAEDCFWDKKKVDLSVFNDFKRCFDHVVGRASTKINHTVSGILKEIQIEDIDTLIFFVSILEQFSLQYFTAALCIAYQLKKNNPSFKIVFAGNCPAKHIKRIMERFKFLDAFLENGNEYAILEYFQKAAVGKPLKSVTYYHGKNLFLPAKQLTLKLDKFPAPDFSLFDLGMYQANGVVVLPYELSRGCVNNCFFCYYIYKGGKIYKKGYKKAVKELNDLKKKYGVERFHFIDAEINFDRDYLTKFCRELIEKKTEILWSALAIPANLDDELLKLMRRAGCVQLRFGVESGGKKLLKAINKNTNPVEMSQILRDAYHAGIYTYVTLLAGLPLEKTEDILATKAFLFKNRKYICSVSVCGYGELGHFGVNVLDVLLDSGMVRQETQVTRSIGKELRIYSKRIGLKEEDIIEDFLSKKGNYAGCP